MYIVVSYLDTHQLYKIVLVLYSKFCFILLADPGSAMLDHFNHLRRQWASKAQFLLANLKRVSSTDMGRVLGKSKYPVMKISS